MFVAKVLLVCAAFVLVSGSPNGGYGAPHQLSASELEQAEGRLQFSLNKLAAGEGPTYRISKIRSASTQVVAGNLDKYNVELIDESDRVKVCDVEIWSRSWLSNGIEVTFICPDEERVIKNHSA